MTSTLGQVRARGVATQSRILERAVHIASVEGLSQMSLATLAKATAMSKSGLFAHFRSKEALQLAIIDEAERMFQSVVTQPAAPQQDGVRRLYDLGMRYVDYSAGQTFEGGCFFAAAAHEFDSKPGVIRDRIIRFVDGWNATLAAATSAGVKQGEVDAGVEIDQLTFEMTGIGLSTNWTALLYGDRKKAARAAKKATDRLIRRIATPKGVSFLPTERPD